MRPRTDRHRNPVAFTTDLAKQAGLTLNVDYVAGDAFPNGKLFTAKLLGDPVATTVRLIDAVGFLTQTGGQRWSYMNMGKDMWLGLTPAVKRWIVGHMYQHEGGTEMADLFK